MNKVPEELVDQAVRTELTAETEILEILVLTVLRDCLEDQEVQVQPVPKELQESMVQMELPVIKVRRVA